MRKTALIPMIALVLALGIAASPASAGAGTRGNSFSNGLGEFINCLIQPAADRAH